MVIVNILSQNIQTLEELINDKPKLSSVRPEVFDLSMIRSSQTFNGQFKNKQNLTSAFSPIEDCQPVKLSSFL